MQLCIDQGNSSTKIGLFDKDHLVGHKAVAHFGEEEIEFLFNKCEITQTILSSVTLRHDRIISLLEQKSPFFIELTHLTPIPIKNEYATPETLGKDRLAGVVGAAYLEPGKDILVIDAGSAITYDFINRNGIYMGGNISPGLDIRFKALHDYTQKLPLEKAGETNLFLGNNTHTAIRSGVVYGIVFEIDGYICELKKEYPELSTFLTGGSTFYFANKLKNAIFANRNIILIGLNRILQYNVQK